MLPPRILAGLFSFSMYCLVIGCVATENQYQPPPPPEVTVAFPLQQPMTPFLEENGVVEAVEVADVRARVQGFVEQVLFEPGADVALGQVLYKIEADRYEASVRSAAAEVEAAEAAINAAKALVATAEAEVKVSQQNLNREQRLLDRNAGSQADFDAAVAAKDAAEAALVSAGANVEVATAELGRANASLAQAQLDLDYTDVKSPIAGRISFTDIKRGNLVENGTILATVVDRDEVFVNFSISDRQMLRFLKEREEAQVIDAASKSKDDPSDWSDIKVYLKREVDEGFPFAGQLNYVDQVGIDSDTGTLGLRAKFDNTDDQLYPGLFVAVRLPIGERRTTVLVPQKAIQRDQLGQFVLTLSDENKVERMSVSVDRIVSGWGVVSGGVTADSPIIIEGLQRARPGLAVTPIRRTLQVDDEALLRGMMPTRASDTPRTDDAENAAPKTVESQTNE